MIETDDPFASRLLLSSLTRHVLAECGDKVTFLNGAGKRRRSWDSCLIGADGSSRHPWVRGLTGSGCGFIGADGCDTGRWGARVPRRWRAAGAAPCGGTDVFPALVTALGSVTEEVPDDKFL